MHLPSGASVGKARALPISALVSAPPAIPGTDFMVCLIAGSEVDQQGHVEAAAIGGCYVRGKYSEEKGNRRGNNSPGS